MGNLLFTSPSSDGYFNADGSRGLFPIQDVVMLEMLEPMSLVALTGTSTLNFYIATTVCPRLPTGVASSMLAMIPFSFAPISIFGVVLSTAAARSKVKSGRYIGMASIILMMELIYTVLIGGVTTALLSATVIEDLKYKWGSFLKADIISVLVFTCLLVIVTVVSWYYLLPYPKFGRSNEASDTLNSDAAVGINGELQEACNFINAAEHATRTNAKAARDTLKEVLEDRVKCEMILEAVKIASKAAKDAYESTQNAQRAAGRVAEENAQAAITALKKVQEDRVECEKLLKHTESACKALQDACEAESTRRAVDKAAEEAARTALAALK